ncbi:Glycoside hydrolase family 3 [Apiospora hydei]|uniref:xylan 1,4-beta-xylosidase n=1 Tax=Apiospora hydei TaxID=1337664 RepID=A0ABR1W7F1_9PEZI
MRWFVTTSCLWWLAAAQLHTQNSNADRRWIGLERGADTPSQKESFLDALLANMTIEDLVLQVHLMFAGEIIGVESKNELYDHTMRFSPGSPIGVMHDWYTLNTTQYNELQQLNLDNSRLKIPLMHTAECLHGVGSFKQSMFPQSLGLSASFDTDLVYRVGRAIAKEARSTGIHACFSPVLDIGQDPRWGRMQEAWGEDKILTSHMGVAYSSGLSKNSSWSEPDAVVPVMKHFAAHGSPQSGRNAAPFMGHGNRQVLQDLLTPFKAAVQLGGAKGVMMAYNEFDDIPAHVHPMLYQALEDWGYDGFVMADDTGMIELETMHNVARSPDDAIAQWFNAGGMLQFYDYSLETYLNTTKGLVANGTVALKTLQSRVRRMLGVKWDLGLFENPFIPKDSPNPLSLVQDHRDLTLEAAQKSIVLLENRNNTLPLRPQEQNINRIALIGPFADTMNYGDYSGAWGQYPAAAAKTLRGGSAGVHELIQQHQDGARFQLGRQHVGIQCSTVERMEVPALDWGMYPPPGLPSNNFSIIWEGELASPVDLDVDGWIGVAVGPNTTAKLYVDDELVMAHGTADQTLFDPGTVMGNIMQYTFTQANSTQPPSGSTPLTFRKGETYRIRIEYQAYNLHKKTENVSSLNSQMILFWNLVGRKGDDAVSQAAELAASADLVVLAVGAAWNSDGESGDRATLGLSPSQDALARAVYATGKPVVLVLQGGRPFAIPEYYASSAAVLSAFFPGQSGGQAIADVLFSKASPGGRMPVTVPRHVGQLPVYYNFKRFARRIKYLDVDSEPLYWFGYGLSYTTFATSEFRASTSPTKALVREQQQQLHNKTIDATVDGNEFTSGDTITFSVNIQNNGTIPGSFVAQVYLLARVSSVVQPVKQLVAFQRVYLEAGETHVARIDLDVDRYLTIYNRWDEWELEKGEYNFSLLAHGGSALETGTFIMENPDFRVISLLLTYYANKYARPWPSIVPNRKASANALVMSWNLLPAELRWQIVSYFELPRLELGGRMPSQEVVDNRAVLCSICRACRCAPEAWALLYRNIVIYTDDEEVASIAPFSSRPTNRLPRGQYGRLRIQRVAHGTAAPNTDAQPGLATPHQVPGLPPVPGRGAASGNEQKPCIVVHNILRQYLSNAATSSSVLPKLTTLQLQVHEVPRPQLKRFQDLTSREIERERSTRRSMVSFDTVCALLTLPTLRHVETWRDDGFESFFDRRDAREPQQQLAQPRPRISHRDWLPQMESLTLSSANFHCGYFYAACEMATNLRHLSLDAIRIEQGHQNSELHSYASLDSALQLRADTLEELCLDGFAHHPIQHLGGGGGPASNGVKRPRGLDCLRHMPKLRSLRVDMQLLFGVSSQVPHVEQPSLLPPNPELPSLLPQNLERLDLRDAWYQFSHDVPELFREDPDQYVEALVEQFQNLAEVVGPQEAQRPLSRLRRVHLRPDAERIRREARYIEYHWLDAEQLGMIEKVLGQVGVVFTYELAPSLDDLEES